MPWLPKRKVVIPVDFSETSLEAIATAVELAAAPSDVYAVHVLVPLEGLSPGVVWGEVNDESREKAVRESFSTYANEHGLDGVHFEVKFGDPGFLITEYATDIAAELIVISSHGYGGFKRFVLGSVAERVIRHAECPVLVLRRSDAE